MNGRPAKLVRTATFFLFLLAASEGCVQSAGQQRDAAQLVALTDLFRAELDSIRGENGFPGATAAFILPDGRQAGVATGVADRGSGLPMPPDAVMPAGSVGKMFVAAVAVALVQEGKLDLDRRIADWLGDEPWFDRLPGGQAITLRQLLTHRSGLPEHFKTAAFRKLLERSVVTCGTAADSCPAPVELIASVLGAEPLFAPGEDFSYADTNYLLAGLIFEKVTGRTYFQELRRLLLDPLSLTLTAPADRRRLPGLVPGYLDPENDFGLPAESLREGLLVAHPGLEWTGGGLVSNPRDLVCFARELFEGRALPGSYLDELLAGRAVSGENEENVRYGLGVFIRDTDLGPTYGHGGWFPGYHTVVTYFARYRIAVAIQVDRDVNSGVQEAIPRLARVILDNWIK